MDVSADMLARIDGDDLAEAIGNLVENATRHARARVSIHTRPDGELIVISVSDDGRGIPEERLEQALARGGQLDRVGSGAGLGLAIVRDIADAWGGRLEIQTRPGGLEANFAVRA